VFLNALERKTGLVSLYCCCLVWTGVDGLSSTGRYEIQLEQNAVPQVIRSQTAFLWGGSKYPCLWGT